MQRAVKAAAAVALGLVAVAATGCLEPFRVEVDPTALAQATDWVRTPGGTEGGFLGPKTKETRYSLDRDPDAPPPFAGSLQVFSIRAISRMSDGELLDLARDLVDRGAADKNITLDSGEASGRRILASGAQTHWFVREGRTTQSGDLFQQGVRVRIVGEVGHDGRSDTSFLAIGMAQVSRTNQCPILVNCQPEQTDLQTWIQIVGDPQGHVQGATSSVGFLHRLVTH